MDQVVKLYPFFSSIWIRGLDHRGNLDDNADLRRFAQTVERVSTLVSKYTLVSVTQLLHEFEFHFRRVSKLLNLASWPRIWLDASTAPSVGWKLAAISTQPMISCRLLTSDFRKIWAFRFNTMCNTHLVQFLLDYMTRFGRLLTSQSDCHALYPRTGATKLIN